MARRPLIYRNPHHESLAEGVARNIREAILLGKLRPGEKIIENELANRMRISRSPIREALRILEQEGLITLFPRKGARVTEISPREVKEIYAIRANLESLAAKLAISNLKTTQMERMENLIKRMSIETKKNDIENVIKLNEKFHELIVNAGDNQRLNQLIQSLKNQIQRFRIASLSLPGRLKVALTEHQKIVEAFRKRDGLLAGELMREHISKAGNRLLKILEKGNKNGQN